jgi:hypothetical protein
MHDEQSQLNIILTKLILIHFTTNQNILYIYIYVCVCGCVCDIVEISLWQSIYAYSLFGFS